MNVFAKFVRSVTEERSTNVAIWLICTALLNVPNEALSTPITEIERGDEVEVLQARDEWLRVRTAIGDEGWILSSAIGARPTS